MTITRSRTARILPLSIAIAALASCGPADSTTGAAALLSSCDSTFDCGEWSLSQSKVGARCYLADGELQPDGHVEVAPGEEEVTWRHERGTLTLCFGDDCAECRNQACPRTPIDCDAFMDRCADSSKACGEPLKRCLTSCSSDHLCRSECHSSAASCYNGCSTGREFCMNQSLRALCG